MAAIGSALAYIGSYFGATGAAAAGTAAASAGAADLAAAGLSSAALVGSSADIAAVGAAGVGAGTAATGAGVTAAEIAAASTAASSIYTLSQGAGKVNVPPTPNTANVDASAQDAQQKELARQMAAGGLTSTVGTPGGQAGSILNPASLSTHSLLGG